MFEEGQTGQAVVFDKSGTDQLEPQLKSAQKKVTKTNQEYNTLKGDVYANHEPVICKDITLLRLERTKRVTEKQDNQLLSL